MNRFPTAGRRYTNGATGLVGTYGSYWSSNRYNATDAYYLTFYSSIPAGTLYNNGKLLGFSVRCVRL